MIETMEASISPTAFSLLLYENMKVEFEQEGFLLGTIIEKETRSITDNDQQQVTITRTLKINGCISCPSTGHLYDNIGRVDQEKVGKLCGNMRTKVIGWYKYKPTSSFSFTLRDKIVHKQLAKLFDLASEQFACCLLIHEKSDNGSTHSYTQKFVRYNHLQYEELPFHIINLSEQNKCYKRPEPVSETFSSITRGLNIDLKETQGLIVITKIQSALQKHTDHMIKELIESEECIGELENEIKQIQTEKLNRESSKIKSDIITKSCDIALLERESKIIPEKEKCKKANNQSGMKTRSQLKKRRK